jgi:hypothetical protein
MVCGFPHFFARRCATDSNPGARRQTYPRCRRRLTKDIPHGVENFYEDGSAEALEGTVLLCGALSEATEDRANSQQAFGTLTERACSKRWPAISRNF